MLVEGRSVLPFSARMSKAFSDEFRSRTPTKNPPTRILYASEFTPLRVEEESDINEVALFSLEKSKRRMAAWVRDQNTLR